MKVIILDIDGVLNSHKILKVAGCCGIDPACVAQLNRVLRATGCKIVLSSAWRYLVVARKPAMTLDGFYYLLRTHGFTNAGQGNPFVGTTAVDEQCAHCGVMARRVGSVTDNGYPICQNCGDFTTRGHQISRWLKENPGVARYCVLDDCDLGIRATGHPFVQTDGKRGLTRGKADRVIAILERERGT